MPLTLSPTSHQFGTETGHWHCPQHPISLVHRHAIDTVPNIPNMLMTHLYRYKRIMWKDSLHTSTVLTQTSNSPWDQNEMVNCHSWTPVYRWMMMTAHRWLSTGNPHTQTSTWMSTPIITWNTRDQSSNKPYNTIRPIVVNPKRQNRQKEPVRCNLRDSLPGLSTNLCGGNKQSPRSTSQRTCSQQGPLTAVGEHRVNEGHNNKKKNQRNSRFRVRPSCELHGIAVMWQPITVTWRPSNQQSNADKDVERTPKALDSERYLTLDVLQCYTPLCAAPKISLSLVKHSHRSNVTTHILNAFSTWLR